MSVSSRAIFVASIGALLAACETTGDPRQGGLFGWSEVKARRRLSDRREEVAAVEAEVARARRRNRQLAARDTTSARQLAQSADALERTTATLRLRETAVRSKAALLERESPTAATASRARQLRRHVEAVFANRALSAVQRAQELGELEAEIDLALETLGR